MDAFCKKSLWIVHRSDFSTICWESCFITTDKQTYCAFLENGALINRMSRDRSPHRPPRLRIDGLYADYGQKQSTRFVKPSFHQQVVEKMHCQPCSHRLALEKFSSLRYLGSPQYSVLSPRKFNRFCVAGACLCSLWALLEIGQQVWLCDRQIIPNLSFAPAASNDPCHCYIGAPFSAGWDLPADLRQP